MKKKSLGDRIIESLDQFINDPDGCDIISEGDGKRIIEAIREAIDKPESMKIVRGAK